MKKHNVKGLRVFLACLLAFVMIASILPIQAAAAGELTVTPDVAAKTVRIEGDLSSLGTGQISLIIMDPSYTGGASDVLNQTDKIVALEQVALTDGKLDITIPLRTIDLKKDYKIFVNGSSISATFQFLIKVTGVSLNKSALTLTSCHSETLIASVSPADASHPEVTWESNDTNIASVDENGKVTAKFPGNAVITAKTVDGEKTASCAVTVKALNYTAKTGETISLPITLDDCNNLAGLGGTIVYDESLLTLQSIAGKTGFILLASDDSFVAVTNNGKGLDGTVVVGYAVFLVKADLPDDVSTFVTFPSKKVTAYNETSPIPSPSITSIYLSILGVPPMRGDVNLDGQVDLRDTILLMQYLADNNELSPRQLKAADVNKDGSVNVGDAIIIMQMCL